MILKIIIGAVLIYVMLLVFIFNWDNIISFFIDMFISKKEIMKISNNIIEENKYKQKTENFSDVIEVLIPEPNEGRGFEILCGVKNAPSKKSVQETFSGTKLGPMSTELDEFCFRATKDNFLKNSGIEIVDFSELREFIKEYRPYMGYYSLKRKLKQKLTFAEMK